MNGDLSLLQGPRGLEGPVSVDALQEAEELLLKQVSIFPTLVLAVNSIDAAALYVDMNRSMSWGNFLHVYRETLRYTFVDDEKQTPVWTEG